MWIRIRGDIYVTSAKGERRKAAQWVGKGGRSRTLRGAQVTDEHHFGGGEGGVRARSEDERAVVPGGE